MDHVKFIDVPKQNQFFVKNLHRPGFVWLEGERGARNTPTVSNHL